MPANTLKPTALLAAAGVMALLLSGCSTPADGPAAEDDPGAAQSASDPANPADTDDSTEDAPAGGDGEATFSYGDVTYSAALQFCTLQGGEDALFHGTAHDEDGAEIGYLSGDFGGLNDAPHGEVRIDFGATEQFESTDSFVALGDAVGPFTVGDFSDTDLIIVGAAWDQDGAQLPAATLKVTC